MGDLTRQKQPPGKGLKICRKMAQNALQMADFSTQSAISEIVGGAHKANWKNPKAPTNAKIGTGNDINFATPKSRVYEMTPW